MTNPSRGELVPGALAMIYGLVDCLEFNSMVVTLYVFCREGVPHSHPLLPDKRICLNPGDGDGWAVTGERVHAGDPTDYRDIGWGFFDEKNLMPINPEPDPLEINQEEQQEQSA